VSVQEKVQDAIESVFGERGTVTGCSRTDSGVHANFYCCVVNVESFDVNIPAEKLPIVLNRFLPEDIAVFEACYVDEGFHPRYDVKYKEYEYLI
jgi:tRNA pseudouridine38-40 synthase